MRVELAAWVRLVAVVELLRRDPPGAARVARPIPLPRGRPGDQCAAHPGRAKRGARRRPRPCPHRARARARCADAPAGPPAGELMVSLVRQVSAGLLRCLARNAVALVALFLALSMGTAWALQTNSVTSRKRADGQVKRIVLPKNSVRSKNIVNGQVQRVDLAGNSVRSEKIANGRRELSRCPRAPRRGRPPPATSAGALLPSRSTAARPRTGGSRSSWSARSSTGRRADKIRKYPRRRVQRRPRRAAGSWGTRVSVSPRHR